MSGFRKAAPQQSAIKMSIFGPPGAGKTFSALLFAEGLAKLANKRVAIIDTETGTNFYGGASPARTVHPEPFDFDVADTRSLTEATKLARALDTAKYGVLVIDSISHLWDAAINSYTGPKTKAGTIPMWAWSKIKQPYKELMKFLLDSPLHVFLLGRQANAFEEDADTGEVKAAGVKMRAEGETAYEPHICLRLTPVRNKKDGSQTIVAFTEKDRSGSLACKRIEWPTFENVIVPVLKVLSPAGAQIAVPSEEGAAMAEAEAIAAVEAQKIELSAATRDRWLAKFTLCETVKEIEALGKKLTPTEKKVLTQADLAAVRSGWLAKEKQLKSLPSGNGQPSQAVPSATDSNGPESPATVSAGVPGAASTPAQDTRPASPGPAPGGVGEERSPEPGPFEPEQLAMNDDITEFRDRIGGVGSEMEKSGLASDIEGHKYLSADYKQSLLEELERHWRQKQAPFATHKGRKATAGKGA